MCAIQKGKKVIILNCVHAWVKQTHYFIQTHWKVSCQMTTWVYGFCSINSIVFIISTRTFSATKPQLFSNLILTDVSDLNTIAHTISQKWSNTQQKTNLKQIAVSTLFLTIKNLWCFRSHLVVVTVPEDK